MFRIASLKTVKKFLVTKKKFMQEMWNVGTTTAMYREKRDKKEKKPNRICVRKKTCKKQKKQWKMGDDDVH